MPFGAQKSNVAHYYAEQYLDASYATAIAQGATWNANVGSGFTMPWYGDIIVEGTAQLDFTPNLLAVELWSATAIAATALWAGKTCEFTPSGGWLTVPFFGKWAGLAAGTFFQMTLQFRVTGASGTATARQFSGLLRAQAT